MSHFSDDLYHKTSLRLGQIIPDFIQNQYPKFVEFLQTYYEFLEQYDDNPTVAPFEIQSGVITVFAGTSEIIGVNTDFTVLEEYQRLKIGTEIFSVRSINSKTSLILFEIATTTQYGVEFFAEIGRSSRQASGALRQILTLHNPATTFPDLESFFRETFLRNLPKGLSDTVTLIPRILDFYRARGSEDSYRFLFRVLYGDEPDIFYPRDYTLKTSDGIYEVPQILRLRRDSFLFQSKTQQLTNDVYALLNREIVGLTSNTRARIAQVREERHGPLDTVALLVEDVTNSTETSNLLLDEVVNSDITGKLLFTDFGVPPRQSYNQIYSFAAVQEQSISQNFIVDEQVITLPVNDPLAIRATVSGSVVGFTVENGGTLFQYGDLIVVPPEFNGGYGGVGKVIGFANTRVSEIQIVNGGEGYYAGLPIIVDNTGTGGRGLTAEVDSVVAGNILLETDTPRSDPQDDDALLFKPGVGDAQFRAARENINYYEQNLRIKEVLFWSLLLNSDVAADDADNLLFDGEDGALLLHFDASAGIAFNDRLVWMEQNEDGEVTYGSLLESTNLGLEPPQLAYADWSMDFPGSVLYLKNFNTKINDILSYAEVYPLFINGIRTSIGEVASIEIISGGTNYIFGVPAVSVQRPLQPTNSLGEQVPRSIVPFEPAEIVAVSTPGSIASLEVVAGGAGYGSKVFDVLWPVENFQYISLLAENEATGLLYTITQEERLLTQNTFITNSISTVTANGSGAEIGIVVGAISTGQPRFRDDRGQLSGYYNLQDITYYQPYSYVLQAQTSPAIFKPVVKQFVHPAGGLLIADQLITSTEQVSVTMSDAEVTAVRDFEFDMLTQTIFIRAPYTGQYRFNDPNLPYEDRYAYYNAAVSAVTLTITAPGNTPQTFANVANADIILSSPTATYAYGMSTNTNVIDANAANVSVMQGFNVGNNVINTEITSVTIETTVRTWNFENGALYDTDSLYWQNPSVYGGSYPAPNAGYPELLKATNMRISSGNGINGSNGVSIADAYYS